MRPRPCPFCGGDKPFEHKGDSGARVITCRECDASAPASWWNYRRAPATPAPTYGPGVHVRLHAVVDPCGRVIVGECEKLRPGESYGPWDPDKDPRPWFRPPANWHQNPACVTHTVDLVLPSPLVTTPQLTFGEGFRRGPGIPFSGPEDEDQ